MILRNLKGTAILGIATAIAVTGASVPFSLEAQAQTTSVVGIGLTSNEPTSNSGVTNYIATVLDSTPATIQLPQNTETNQPSVNSVQNYNLDDIQEVSYVRYPTTQLNIRQNPSTDSEILDRISTDDEVTVIGELPNSEFVVIEYDGHKAFVSSQYLSEEKTEPEVAEYVWEGKKLNTSDGVVTGPSGKETYYNLPMSGVIKAMRSLGYTDEYWVRGDGVKMLGQYVMVAANLRIRPKGTILPTSLGMGIVADTGDFASSNPTQLDIAVDW